MTFYICTKCGDISTEPVLADLHEEWGEGHLVVEHDDPFGPFDIASGPSEWFVGTDHLLHISHYRWRGIAHTTVVRKPEGNILHSPPALMGTAIGRRGKTIRRIQAYFQTKLTVK